MPYKKREDHNKALKRYYSKNKEMFRKNKIGRKRKIKNFILEYKLNNKCNRCDESHPVCLQFHHTDPMKKDLNISRATANCWSLEKLKKEIEKCELLCANCHFKEHAGNYYKEYDIQAVKNT